jgi:hypothetical protein
MHGTSAGVPVTLSGLGGLVTLAGPDSVPEGASPRNYDFDFTVGSCNSRAGLTSVYTVTGATVGPNAPTTAISATWANPNNILAADGSYASFPSVVNTNLITVNHFVFALPSTDSITGIQVNVTGYSDAPASIQAQLTFGGVPRGTIKTIALPTGAPAVVTLGSLSDTWGAFPIYSDVNSTSFGLNIVAISSGFNLATAYLDGLTMTLGVTTGGSNFQFITDFVSQDGIVKNILLDASGSLWIENVTLSPGNLSLLRQGITPNSFATGVNGPDVEYLTFSDGFTGSDMPLQYTPQWIDRITQVGPGAAPVFTPISSSANSYTISTITQPIAQNWGSSYFLQSGGPGSTSAGNVVTIYYSDSTVNPAPDPDLVEAFNSGLAPVYVYTSFTGGPATQGPYVQQVTSVGQGQPPGQPRKFWYFTYTLPTVAFTYYQGSGHPTYTAHYQRTIATMTMTAAVPGLVDGNQVTITGASVAAYDAQWTIIETPNSGQYVITATQVTAGIATYNYSYAAGTTVPPGAGQLITVTGTTANNGNLNVVGASIVTGGVGVSGTFTVNVSLPNSIATAENGIATTAGTIFLFDPGAQYVGTTTNPIYGASAGGSFTFGANAQFIANGTRQGTVFFITRNGYYTAPAPPVQFTTPIDTTSIVASNIPIGPPNVIARGIAITGAGQLGVPGANFFVIPTDVKNIVNGVTQLSTATIINDNTSTTATFSFSDFVLTRALNIGVYGYNLFNQIEIGDPAWVKSYDDRNFYGLCQNKVQNFNNLSFDGGYLPSAQLFPLGWTHFDAYGQLTVSPKFGNAWYISNPTVSLVSPAGVISQTAYQDTYSVPIIQPNTKYSVRVTARIPSGITVGSLNIQLINNTAIIGTFQLPFTAMTTVSAIFSGTLLTSPLAIVPSALLLQVSANLGSLADVEIDRIEIFPTAIPILTTTVYGSYAGLPEQVDAVTGMVLFQSENQQPVNGAKVMYDTFYGLKGWHGDAPGSSLYSLQKNAGLEPAQWDEPEVAQEVGGAIGVYAFDDGEQWFLGATRAGLYLFEGGQPGKINQEIVQVWDAINWKYGYKIWVRVDSVKRKILVGVPMATPNFWLPNAPVNSNPTSPNVILMCNYQGLDSGQELKSEPQMHTTMFGTLNSIDMRRKWSIWQIPSPFANVVPGATDQQIYICNGKGNSKVYALDENAATDDGTIIDSLYTTAGLVELSKRQQAPGAGWARMRWGYMLSMMESLGTINVTFYPNNLLGPGPFPTGYNAWSVPGGFQPGDPAMEYSEAPLNFAATRTFIEFRENDGQKFNLSNLVLHAKKDVWNAIRGAK